MTTDTPIRKSVPLTPGEAQLLEAARTEGSPAYEALTELLGTGAARSEAAAIHAAVRLGLQAIEDRISEKGYAALAAAENDEDRAFHAAMRQRGRRAGGGE